MSARNKYTSLVMAVNLLVCITATAHNQKAPPNPRAILSESGIRYSRASSYQDSGVVKVYPADPMHPGELSSYPFRKVLFQDTTLVTFRTYFLRHHLKFRFEWESPYVPSSRTAVVWSDGGKIYQWVPDRISDKDRFILDNKAALKWAVDEALGSSGGAVFFIPSLLFKDVGYFSFADMMSVMTDLSLGNEEKVDGDTCYVIKGRMSGTPWMIWVSKESYLVRKTRTIYSGGPFHKNSAGRDKNTFIAEEIHSNIKLNAGILDSVFKYKPQLQANDLDLSK